MKTINLTVFSFDELSENVQKKIIERERWNVMEQCMDDYGIDYKKSMKAFENLTNTEVYNYKVGYSTYYFCYKFKYGDPIYEHPTDYHCDIYILRIYAVNYCSDISTTILCHILSRASISPCQVNILMGNTNTSTSIVG